MSPYVGEEMTILISTCLSTIYNSNVMCYIIRGYEVIMQDIQRDDNERVTLYYYSITEYWALTTGKICVDIEIYSIINLVSSPPF